MQNMSKTLGLALATVLFTASAAAAQDNNALAFSGHSAASFENADAPASFRVKLSQPQKDSLVFRLSVENPSADKVLLLIKDRNSNILHREVIPATPLFTGRYNLQGLEDGDYTFEVRNGRNKIVQKTVEIKTELSVNRSVSVE
ncbi:hypothetical protein F0L74_03810 [Chitinophaga agrisoli]|uniref:Secreted protein (Por secretion system target) n=1 Tax=Chitinophaga agrisoli TaxID=2607653 RepID=A0A5B2W3U7_9BACT|nr:hypothetical protein [Chitinophaga agrisoli]KAA2245097.1 hypothetical protein F0L74_03810 [Chitinophaga agrisoli]